MNNILEMLFKQANAGKKIGDEIEFGKFYKDNASKMEPLKWVVLDVTPNSYLVITKECIMGKNFNEEQNNTDWEQCSLRKWLNNDFYNLAFSSEEQKYIINTEITNEDGFFSIGMKPNKLSNTNDRIFILSVNEARILFKNDESRQAKVTKYAAETGADFDYIEGRGRWWLRTTNKNLNFAYAILFLGRVSEFPFYVNDGDGAIRPVMYIKKEGIH